MKALIIRISNVLAWIAFVYISCSILITFLSLAASDEPGMDYFVLLSVASLPWLACLIINYIAVGSARILPWKSISDESDPKA
jgi:hypothetical protein